MIRFIDDNDKLYQLLAESMDKYSYYYWSVAWMGEPEGLYEKLFENKNKIKLLVTGLYGPDNKSPITSIRFVNDFGTLLDENYQPRVIYLKRRDKRKHKHFILHSKLYYFENSDSDWRLFVGSANFSDNALRSKDGNLEAVLVCDQDSFSNESVKAYFNHLRASCHDHSYDFRPYQNSSKELIKYKNLQPNETKDCT